MCAQASCEKGGEAGAGKISEPSDASTSLGLDRSDIGNVMSTEQNRLTGYDKIAAVLNSTSEKITVRASDAVARCD